MENKNELPLLRLPVIVEGRYDKSAILGMYRGTVITTDGFGVFNSKEKQALIKRLAKDGIILLTDPDGGGVQIRSFISGIVPKEKIYHLYVPKIAGKEKSLVVINCAPKTVSDYVECIVEYKEG